MLITRTISGIVLIGIAGAALYFGGYFLLALALVAYAIINFEFLSFATATLSQQRRLLFLLSYLLLPLGYLLMSWHGLASALVAALVVIMFSQIVFAEIDEHTTFYFSNFTASLVGLSYTGIIGTFLVIVAAQSESEKTITWILSIVIASDTFAYFGGRLIGGRKLAPHISPGKTVSGAFVGLVSAIAVGIVTANYFNLSENWLVLVACTVLASILAQIGDLIESLVKRCYQTKDSGSLIPGHGGLLDRVDSLMFAMPVVMLFEGVK